MEFQSFDLKTFESRKLKFYALADKLSATKPDDCSILEQECDFEDIDERVVQVSKVLEQNGGDSQPQISSQNMATLAENIEF